MAGGCATWMSTAPRQNTLTYTGQIRGLNKENKTNTDEAYNQKSKAKGKKCPMRMPDDKTKTSQQQGLCVLFIIL